MDRDPQAITEDVRDFDAAVAALDPQHFWKFTQASSHAPDSGFGNITLNLTGAPAFAQATGLDGITGVQLASGSFFTGASALPASTTTFTILALVKLLTDYLDTPGLLFGDHVAGPGLYLTQTTRVPYFQTVTGVDRPDGQDTLPNRTTFQLGIVVTAGVSRFYLNGVGYAGAGTGSTDSVIETFTPTRVGAVDATTGRLRALVSRLVYMPGVALTEAQIAELWSTRFSCHAASLAIVNKALSEIGQSRALTNLSTDTTPAGVAARLHLGSSIEAVLYAFAWPWANRYETLTRVGGTDSVAVNSDWQYSYRAPDRIVRALRLVQPGMKRRYDPNPPPFYLGQDALGPLVFTDFTDATNGTVLEFTARTSCPASQGGAWFRNALQWYLSACFAPTLSKNEKTKEFCLAMAQSWLDRAATGAANEEQPQDTNRNDPSWLTAR